MTKLIIFPSRNNFKLTDLPNYCGEISEKYEEYTLMLTEQLRKDVTTLLKEEVKMEQLEQYTKPIILQIDLILYLGILEEKKSEHIDILDELKTRVRKTGILEHFSKVVPVIAKKLSKQSSYSRKTTNKTHLKVIK